MRDKNGRYIKGHINTHKKDTALKISQSLKGKYVEGKHCGWKGEKVKYQGLHIWIRKYFDKAIWCSWCGSCVRVQWANISGKYRRDRHDFIQLCRKCHHKFDSISQKIWFTRKNMYKEVL